MLAVGRHLLLIGISPKNAATAVWCGRQINISSAQELVDSIFGPEEGGAQQ
ncbi:MAG TPA: hypothetical protein PLJ35_18655 [Anaerolineae bacterium]|nr:hypothetical protein [Anaerolineae bacterium]HPL29766.1 hypothetical protein [Anaerolineae bacterium]